jgi:RNA polymerase sigma factor (sigma-70 family)
MTCAICEAVIGDEVATCPSCGFEHKVAARPPAITRLSELSAMTDEPVTDEEMLPGSAPTQHGHALASQLWSAVELCELPARLRKVLELRYLNGLSMREIGEALSVNESRASQLHKHALEQLRTGLSERGFAEACFR